LTAAGDDWLGKIPIPTAMFKVTIPAPKPISEEYSPYEDMNTYLSASIYYLFILIVPKRICNYPATLLSPAYKIAQYVNSQMILKTISRKA
jgi:hypothetical protein